MRVKIINQWYFQKKDLSEITKSLRRSENTVLNQLSIALDELSAYFFGAYGLSAKSMSIPKGTTIAVSIKPLSSEHEVIIKDWLNRGELCITGQWRKTGKRRFVWEDV